MKIHITYRCSAGEPGDIVDVPDADALMHIHRGHARTDTPAPAAEKPAPRHRRTTKEN